MISSPAMARTEPPVFFVSYAHSDAEHPEHRKNLENFVEDLSAEVARILATPREGVSFFDPGIQNGEVWSDVLGDALMRCRRLIPLSQVALDVVCGRS